MPNVGFDVSQVVITHLKRRVQFGTAIGRECGQGILNLAEIAGAADRHHRQRPDRLIVEGDNA